MKTAVLSVLGLAVAINAQYLPSVIYETEVNTVTSCGPYVTNCAVGQESSTVYTRTTEVSETETPYATPTPEESTKYATTLETITSCPPEVTNCPASHKPTSTPAVPYTTSTIKITKEYTITSCAPTVTNCPVGAVTTTVIESTTVCPISQETSKPYYSPVETSKGGESYPAPPAETHPAPPAYTAAPPVYSPAPPAGPVYSTLTISTCVPTVITSVITVTGVPTPTAPTAQSPSTVHGPYGTAAPSGYPVPPTNNGTVPFTGSASTQRAGGILFAAIGLAAALL